MKVNYLTREYELSHGRTPRGRGSWALQLVAIDDNEGEGEVHFSRGGLTLTEAKRELLQRLKTEALSYQSSVREIDVNVLP